MQLYSLSLLLMFCSYEIFSLVNCNLFYQITPSICQDKNVNITGLRAEPAILKVSYCCSVFLTIFY